MKKKAAALIFSALFALGGISASADFTDMPEGATGEAIQKAVDNKILNGYDDNTVRPDENITRAQMAAILVRAFGASKKDDISPFWDVSPDAWYADDVGKSLAMGIFKGDENGCFNPENAITFQETYTVLTRAFRLGSFPVTFSSGPKDFNPVDAKALDGFNDAADVAQWARDYALAFVDHSNWKGIDGYLKPQDSVTRGEFALIMDSLVSDYIDTPGEYTLSPTGVLMIRTGGVTVNNLKTNKNIIIGYSVDNTGVTLNTAAADTKNSQRAVSAPVVILGGAVKEPKFNDDGTFDTFTLAQSPGIHLRGSFGLVAIYEPFIAVDAQGAVIQHMYGTKNTAFFTLIN